MSAIIEIKNISKSYSINRGSERYVALRDVIANVFKSPFKFIGGKAKKIAGKEKKEVFWALKGVTASIKRGEVVGLIGPNGAGKSTLLKVLNRITEPTSGEVVIHGKISSLLEVGTGFHPELTGRENIFFSGAILGMKRREIVRKFSDIVRFAEMEQFIDTPVKRYSSGMHVRLAFSVAVHMEPDILLIDEVLAVGDASFQKKCLEKIHEVAKKDGRTILFVSHNLDAVQSLCERAIYLDHGQVKMIGQTGEVIKAYLDHQANGNSQSVYELPAAAPSQDYISRVTLKNADGLPEAKFEAGKSFSVAVDYHLGNDRTNFMITLQCTNEYGSTVFFTRDSDKNPNLAAGRKKGDHSSIFHFPANTNFSLNMGRYALSVRIYQDPSSELNIPFEIIDPTDRFPHHPGSVWIAEPWQAK